MTVGRTNAPLFAHAPTACRPRCASIPADRAPTFPKKASSERSRAPSSRGPMPASLAVTSAGLIGADSDRGQLHFPHSASFVRDSNLAVD